MEGVATIGRKLLRVIAVYRVAVLLLRGKDDVSMYGFASAVVEVADGLKSTLLYGPISRWVQRWLAGNELIPNISCRSCFHWGRGEPIASVTTTLQELTHSKTRRSRKRRTRKPMSNPLVYLNMRYQGRERTPRRTTEYWPHARAAPYLNQNRTI